MRLPYINLRWVAASLVVLLLTGGSVFGWLWYAGRPDKLWESALDYYHEGEKLRGAGDPQKKVSDDDKAKAKSAYEHARTQIELFITKAGNKDPRIAQAHMLRFKILWPLAGLNPDDAGNLQGEAFRSGQTAATLDDKNMEAQAVMVFDNFRRNDFRGAYPYARNLIDNLPSDPKSIDLDDFNEYVIGAYYVVALKDLENNHPDEALKDLEASLAREKAKPNGKTEQRWRAVLVEVQALQKKADLSKDPKVVKPTDEKLKTVLMQAVDRARAEKDEMVPAADGKPEMPRVASMSLTNTNGMIDVLLISVLKADSHQAVADRANVLIQVCEKMADAPGANPWVYQDAVRGSSRLAFMNGGLPQTNRLDPKEMVEVQRKTVAINETVLKNGGPIDPMAYLEMSRSAQQTPAERPRALELAKRGLRVASDQHIAANDPRVLALQSQAAWLLLLDRKVKDAEEYLSLIAKQQRMLADVAYMRGLGAVLDGRLEEGVKQLNEAHNAARFKDNLPLLLGLSHAYLAQNQVENAVPVLEELIRIRKAQDKLNRDDAPWVEIWQPNIQRSALDLMKCYLALALKAPTKADAKNVADKAGKLFQELQNSFLSEEAHAAVLNFDLARLQALEAKDPNSIEADILRGQMAEKFGKLPPVAKNDPRLLWTEINFILNKKETNPAVVGGAIAASLGAPNDLAMRVGELGLVRAGMAWQWRLAEERMMKAASEQHDSMAMQLAWVRWLVMSARNEEALAKLTELEDKASDQKERTRILATKAQLLLAAGKKTEADEIIQNLRNSGSDKLTGEMLYYWELMLSNDPEGAREILKKVMNQQDQTGLYHFWKGQQAQADGDFVQAIQSYERSMEFTQFKARSEKALLECILGMQNGPAGKPDKANPEAALKETKRLRAAHPHNAGVLLAYAVAARVMDEIYGEEGMDGALSEMIKVLNDEKVNAANGPFVAAQQWVAAGRADLARQTLKEGLKQNKKHLPSLILATQLAFADEDWTEAAEDLKAVTALQPDALDVPLWRAALLESRGETSQAEEIYTKFIEDHPNQNMGYLAMSRLNERAKKYKEALTWIKKWREKMPDELNGMSALVRVLAEDGQAAEASKEAEKFLNVQVAKANAARAEFEAKNPITEKDKDKAKEEAEKRAKSAESAIDSLRLSLTLQFVGIFQQAKAFAEAEKWLDQRAGPLLDKLPESAKKNNRNAVKMVRASILMSRGRLLKANDPERAKLMDQAIKEYDEVYKDLPGDLVSGNNLAWLLVKEKNQSARAVGLIDEVRKGKYSRRPVSPERLSVELLDTIGTVYHAGGLNQESYDLFKQAVDSRYSKDPRVLMYLGMAQEGLQRKSEAHKTFSDVYNLADTQAKATPDPERKERLEKLAAEAKAEQKNMGVLK